jgi:hypothetical protein
VPASIGSGEPSSEWEKRLRACAFALVTSFIAQSVVEGLLILIACAWSCRSSRRWGYLNGIKTPARRASGWVLGDLRQASLSRRPV